MQDKEQYQDTLRLAVRCSDVDKQAECLRRLCVLEPQEVTHVVDRAQLLMDTGRPLMAAATYRSGIKRMPTNAELYFNMSELCQTSKLPRLQNMRLQVSDRC